MRFSFEKEWVDVFFRKKVESGITVVVSSRVKDDEENGFAKHITDTCGCGCRVVYVINPEGVSLTNIYSDILSSEDITTDIIVFVHDDVKFLRKGWGRDIIKLFADNDEYGIIGVAGAADFQQPCAWWNGKKIYGQVLHRHDGKSWLSAYSDLLGDKLAEVCVVDGLFMAVSKSRVKENFDKSFEGFNFYDIDFCLANFLSRSCKIGVTTKVRLAHESIGALSDNWYANRDKLVAKYGDKFPIEV